MFAVYDTVDNCYMGNNKTHTGPKTYASFREADAAARDMATRLHYPSSRLKPVTFENYDFHYKDEVEFQD